jgi:hypothetical protein
MDWGGLLAGSGVKMMADIVGDVPVWVGGFRIPRL